MNFIVLSQQVFDFIQENEFHSSGEIPFNLGLRNKELLWFSMIGISISFVLLAFSRLASNNIVFIYSRILYKNTQIEKILKEQFSLSSFSSIVLVINFIVTTTFLLYLTYIHFHLSNRYELFYFYPILPLYFFLWPMLCYYLIGLFTKNHKVFKENRQNNIVLSQFLSILFSLLLLLWTFNMKWSIYFIYAFVFLFVIFWLYKIFRGFLFSINHGIAWYYIILYFCTLEILPLVLFYNILVRKFGDFWMII